MFDPEQVKLLTGLGDEQIQVLTQTFLTEVRDSCQKLEACFAASDWTGIRKLAHMVKPSYFLMGINEMVPLIDFFLAIDQHNPDVAALELNILHFQQLGLLLERELVLCARSATALA